jgi:hypothetical protein
MTVMTEAEFRQIFRAADAGQPFVLFEKAFQGDGGGGLAALDQFFDGGVNSFMRGDEKMILAQEIADLLHRPVVDQRAPSNPCSASILCGSMR